MQLKRNRFVVFFFFATLQTSNRKEKLLSSYFGMIYGYNSKNIHIPSLLFFLLFLIKYESFFFSVPINQIAEEKKKEKTQVVLKSIPTTTKKKTKQIQTRKKAKPLQISKF